MDIYEHLSGFRHTFTERKSGDACKRAITERVLKHRSKSAVPPNGTLFVSMHLIFHT